MEKPLINLADEADFEVGDLRVRPSAREVLVHGDLVRLEPRVMQVLVCLNRRRGETVGRDQLLEECWGGVAVGDDALVRSVSQLRKLVGNGDGGFRIDTVPKVGYRLVVPAGASRARSRSAAVIVGAAAVAALALHVGHAGRPDSSKVPSLSVPITSTPGVEQWPAISPSGGQVAYVRGAPRELYVQSIGSSTSLRLTDSPEDEHHPVWSPDGARLAFARRGTEACGIHEISPFGGAVTRLADCGSGEVLSLDWSPSGDELAYTVREGPWSPGRAFLVDLSTGARTSLLDPEDAAASVEEIVFAPDGRTIAFTLSAALGVEDLYAMSFDSGAIARVTGAELKIHGFDWLPDGSGFVVSSNRGGEFALWRVSRSGDRWAPIPGAVGGADEPRVSSSGRLVYEAWRSSADVYRARPPAAEDASPLAPSTRYQWDARPSRDGRRIAFISDRSGSAEVWIADADGANPARLTSFGGAYTHTPRFSPDGRSIAFATPGSGNFDLYVVDVETRELRRLTRDPAEDFAPAWAPDGRSLYFGSTRSGGWQIWKLDLETEQAIPITPDGGRVAQVSPDGETLYYVKADRQGLFRLDTDSAEVQVIEDLQPVDWNNWHVIEGAVYYVRRPVPNEPEIVRYDLASGRTTTVRSEPRLLHKSGIWIDDEETEILFTRVGVSEADLMLIESVPR